MSGMVTSTEWELMAAVFRGAQLADLLQAVAKKVEVIGWDARIWDVTTREEEDGWAVTVYWMEPPGRKL